MTWFAIITGVDDAGPYEIIGPDETDADTPVEAFHNVHGFWDEVDTTGVRKMHIRIYDEDEYVYAWDPTNPDILEGVYSGETISLGGNV